MNSKTIVKRVLPLIIVLAVIIIVAVACTIFPKKDSRASLSDKYINGDKATYLSLKGIDITSQEAYDILTSTYGTGALVDLIDEYLVSHVKSPRGVTYLEEANADVQGFDNWLYKKIFPNGTAVEKLPDLHTTAQANEAKEADEKTIKTWYEKAMSSYNANSTAAIKAVYKYEYAKYLYVIDSLMDEHIFKEAHSTVTILAQYVEFAVHYAKNELGLKDKELAEFEKNVYSIYAEYANNLYDLVNATSKTNKITSKYTKSKVVSIDLNSVNHIGTDKRDAANWNTVTDIATIFTERQLFLADLMKILNDKGATFTTVNDLVEEDDAPSITSAYSSAYEKDLQDKYWAMYVEFNTTSERDNALAQINVAIIDYIWVEYDSYYEAYNLKDKEATDAELIDTVNTYHNWLVSGLNPESDAAKITTYTNYKNLAFVILENASASLTDKVEAKNAYLDRVATNKSYANIDELAKAYAIEYSKLDAGDVLNAMVKLYNNYNSNYEFAVDGSNNYVLDANGNKTLKVLPAISGDELAVLNKLINVWLAYDAFDENGINKNGSNFDLEWLIDDSAEAATRRDSEGNLYTDYAAYYDFLSQFCFTNSELGKVSSSFQTLINSTLKNGLVYYNLAIAEDDLNNTDYAIDISKVYGPTSTSNSSFVALKLSYTKGTAYGKAWSDLVNNAFTYAEYSALLNEDYKASLTTEEVSSLTANAVMYTAQLKEMIDITESNVKASYTDSIKTTALGKVRENYGLVIYDDVFEKAYISSYNNTHKATKKTDKVLVAKLVYKNENNEEVVYEISADMIYEAMANRYGLVAVLSLYEENYFINSSYSRANEVYDYNKKKWLTKSSAYEEVITKRLDEAKDTFDYYNAYYVSQGYTTMTWEEFLETVYYSFGVKNSDDLKWYFVYKDAEEQFAKYYAKLGSFDSTKDTAIKYDGAKYDANGLLVEDGARSLWEVLYAKSLEASVKSFGAIDSLVNDYFSIAGYHVLVSVRDKDDSVVNPIFWSDSQVYYAEKLYAKVVEVLNATKADKRASTMQSIIESFDNTTPLLDMNTLQFNADGSVDLSTQVINNEGEKGTLDAEDYEYSIYKTLGLHLTYETLSTITDSDAEKYDSDFIKGIHSLYNQIIKVDGVDTTQSELSSIYGVDSAYGEEAYVSSFDNNQYLRTAFGYHVYVATAVTANSKYTFTSSQISSTDFDLSVEYTNKFLTPEIIIYLTREALDTNNDGKVDEVIRLDDTLLAMLDSSNELSKIFANWYSDSYSYHTDNNYFSTLVSAVRELTESKLGKLTDPNGKDEANYYVTANGKFDESKGETRKGYAQKAYLLDLLTKYYNDMISKYYTPVLNELSGSSNSYGYEYLVFVNQMASLDLTTTSADYKFAFDVIKNIDLSDDVIYVLDADGNYVLDGTNKVSITYDARNGSTTLKFVYDYMLETMSDGLKYTKDFVCHQVGLSLPE